MWEREFPKALNKVREEGKGGRRRWGEREKKKGRERKGRKEEYTHTVQFLLRFLSQCKLFVAAFMEVAMVN